MTYRLLKPEKIVWRGFERRCILCGELRDMKPCQMYCPDCKKIRLRKLRGTLQTNYITRVREVWKNLSSEKKEILGLNKALELLHDDKLDSDESIQKKLNKRRENYFLTGKWTLN